MRVSELAAEEDTLTDPEQRCQMRDGALNCCALEK